MSDLEKRIAAAKRAIRDASIDGVQRRTVPLVGVEVRAKGDGTYTLAGHAAVFNSLSVNLGGFREVIKPGAFADVLATNPDVRAFLNHDPNLLLARTANGTLRIEEDGEGLAYEADVAPTSYGLDLRILLDRGDLNQSSFAFRIARGGDEWDEDAETGLLLRTITKFGALYDVSPVATPAYEGTDVGLASAHDGEREGDGLSAGERTDDGASVDEQADKGLSREFVARDLAARARLLDA